MVAFRCHPAGGLSAPKEVTGSYEVVFGYDGPFTLCRAGLIRLFTYDGSINTASSLVSKLSIPAAYLCPLLPL